jgi:hypothetical protein
MPSQIMNPPDQTTADDGLLGTGSEVKGGTGIAAAQTIPSADGTLPVIIGEYGDSDVVINSVHTLTPSHAAGHVAWWWSSGTDPLDLFTNNFTQLSGYGQKVAAAIAALHQQFPR